MENGSKGRISPPSVTKSKLKKAIVSLKKFMQEDYKLTEGSVYRKSKAAENLTNELDSLNVTSFGEFDLHSFAKFIIEEQKKKFI